ncbi:response regulator transcription factor [Geodermatophilus sp. SYSU D00965]
MAGRVGGPRRPRCAPGRRARRGGGPAARCGRPLDRHDAPLAPVSTRVLVVDDHQRLRRDAGHRPAGGRMDVVGTATSAAQAVSLAERTQPDVVVMDIQMPREDGLSPPGGSVRSPLAPSSPWSPPTGTRSGWCAPPRPARRPSSRRTARSPR